MFEVFQPVLIALGFVLIFAIVFFVGRIPPLGKMYATVFILIGKVLLRIEQWIEPFDTARRVNKSKNPGLRTIILMFFCFLALAAGTAETFNTLQSLNALFTDANIALPALPGVLNFSMGLLFLAVPALTGSVYLEIKKALPEEAKLFVVPETHAQKFERYIVSTFVLSVITSIAFYTLKAVYLASPDSNGTHLLQIVALIMLGVSLPLSGAIILYVLCLGISAVVGLLLTIVWFLAATLTDVCDFLSRLFTGQDVLTQGVRDKNKITVKEVTEQNPTPVPQIKETGTQVIERDKATSGTPVIEKTSVGKDEVEILIPPPQEEEIIISKQDEKLYQTVLQIVEQRKKEIERVEEEKRKAVEEARKEEARRQAEQTQKNAVLQRLEDHKRRVEQEAVKGRKPGFNHRKSLPIEAHGDQTFIDSIQSVLDELRNKAPYRYDEAIQFLPKAEYVPSMAGTFSGRSDGLFSINGSGELSDGKWLNSYEWFKFVFLHELGHDVHIFLSDDRSEVSADEYAKQVLDEMGIDVTQYHWWANRTHNCAPMLAIEH